MTIHRLDYHRCEIIALDFSLMQQIVEQQNQNQVVDASKIWLFENARQKTHPWMMQKHGWW